MTQTFIEKKVVEFNNKFIGLREYKFGTEKEAMDWLRQTLTEALSLEKRKIVEKLEEMRKLERYTLAAAVIVDEKNINYNLGLDDAIAKIME